MEKRKINEERSLSVVKKNDIVQKARYRLDLIQQKTIMYLISKINSIKDSELPEVTVDIKDLCEIMGIDKRQGKNIAAIKNALQKLADKSMWVEMGDIDDTLVLMRWLSEVEIKRGRGTVTVQFDGKMAPYLLKIEKCFVEYRLINVLPMKSQYSLRLYELIKSHNGQGKWTVTLDDLRKDLFVENILTYADYRDFKKRILDTAIMEICNFTDLLVAYEVKRRDRKIYSITFEMCECRESRTEYARRENNRTTVLDNLPAEIVPPRKMPTVKEIREERQKQQKAAELKKLENKYNRAKKPIDYSEPAPTMPGQTTIEDLC